jgi:hypothetical protein
MKTRYPNLNGFMQLIKANPKFITTANGGFTSHVHGKKICSKLSEIRPYLQLLGSPEKAHKDQ